MDRLTDCAQGYCEMYCKKYMLCFEDPEDCIFKDEIKLYDAIKSIEGIVPFDRLLELAVADKAGRLVVLPCKVGDKVRVDARTWGDTWNYKTVDGGKYLLGEIVAIIKTRKQILIKIRVEHNVSWKSPMRRYPISAIGKTVFLTREEAEAALAQEGGDLPENRTDRR